MAGIARPNIPLYNHALQKHAFIWLCVLMLFSDYIVYQYIYIEDTFITFLQFTLYTRLFLLDCKTCIYSISLINLETLFLANRREEGVDFSVMPKGTTTMVLGGLKLTTLCYKVDTISMVAWRL